MALQQQQATRDRLTLGLRHVVDKTAVTAAGARAMPGWRVPALSPVHTAQHAAQIKLAACCVALPTVAAIVPIDNNAK